MRGLACFLMLFLISVVPALSQDSDSPVIDQVRNMLASENGGSNASPDGPDPEDIFVELPPGVELDGPTLEAIQDALRGYYQYRVDAYIHRQNVFAWQHTSTIIIFFTVIVIVFVGLYFSWIQFHQTENKSEMGETRLKADSKGFDVSSPVLGVIILLISLAFFYLYLVHVYPVNDTI